MKHIPIKIISRCDDKTQNHYRRAYDCISGRKCINFGNYSDSLEIEEIDGIFYYITWLNKHDTSLDKIFNNPLDQLESLSIR